MEIMTRISDNTASTVVHLQMTDDSGKVTTKDVAFQDYLEALTHAATDCDDVVRLGRMPEGYYDGAISPSYTDTFRVSMILPGEVRLFAYYEEEMAIPFPTLCFMFQTHKGNVAKSKVYALKEGVPRDDSVLYHYPYGNVYQDGRICWGSNRLPEIHSMNEFNKLVMLFFGSPTNNDLWGTCRVSENFSSQRELIEKVKDLSTFPEKLLKVAGPCLGDLMK